MLFVGEVITFAPLVVVVLVADTAQSLSKGYALVKDELVLNTFYGVFLYYCFSNYFFCVISVINYYKLRRCCWLIFTGTGVFFDPNDSACDPIDCVLSRVLSRILLALLKLTSISAFFNRFATSSASFK